MRFDAPNRCAAALRSVCAGRLAIAAATLVAFAAPAGAAVDWRSDPAHSRLTFAATQAGARFEGRFRSFVPQITFEASDLAHSRFVVTVDTSTADTQDHERDETLRGKDFFDVTRWTRATFETTGFTSLGAGRYEATGRLTIRDVTKPVKLDFTFTPGSDSGASATLTGATTIRRLDFGVGQGEWTDTTWVGNDVEIRFELALSRATAAAR